MSHFREAPSYTGTVIGTRGIGDQAPGGVLPPWHDDFTRRLESAAPFNRDLNRSSTERPPYGPRWYGSGHSWNTNRVPASRCRRVGYRHDSPAATPEGGL